MATQSRSVDGAMPERDDLTRSLVADLSHPDGRKRQRAREALVDMGHVAVPPLVEALQSKYERVRWEAAKALGEIADPSATNALLPVMLDEDPEIRWLAGEALAAIGWPAVEPLLHALVQKADRTLFRNVAHFVLRTIENRDRGGKLQPVLDAMNGAEPSMQTPIAAEDMLIQLMNDRFRAA